MEGGFTFFQDEKSAKHPGMPQSALPIAEFVEQAELAAAIAALSGRAETLARKWVR